MSFFHLKHHYRARRGGVQQLDDQDKIALEGEQTIGTLEKYIPVVGEVSAVVNPIANALISKLPSKELDSAKRGTVDKYYNLFHDDQFIYNPDGTLKYPKKVQIWYMLGQRYLVNCGRPQGDAGYHPYLKKIQKELGLTDKEAWSCMPWIAFDHNH
jgi:hypothetical protein